LSVRQLEALCQKKENRKSVKVQDSDPFIEDLKLRMQRKFATKVEITNKAITIRYNDTEDLNRILDIMNVIEE